MKKLHYYVLFIAFVSCSTSGNFSKNDPKISVLGTVHFPTENVNADSIYNVLLKFEPDMILTEIGQENMYEDFTYKKLYNENEMVSVVRYKMNHPKVQLRPIDIFERNEKRKALGVFSEASPVFQNLNKLNREKSFSNKEQVIWNKFSDYWKQSDNIGKSELKTINSKESDKVVDSLIYYQYFKLKEIVDQNPLFEKSKMANAKKDTISQRNYFATWADFEMSRNKAIAENVHQYIKENPHKRIIVLIGFKHRFFIKEYLEHQGVNLSEYYN